MGKRDPIRILDLRDSPWVDGPGRTILEIADALSSEGFQYVIGSLGKRDSASPYAEKARQMGLAVEVIHERGPLDPRSIPQVLRILRESRAGIVHAHEFRSNAIGLVCARWAGTKLVTTAHGWIANNAKGKAYTLLDKLLLRFFDRVIVVSERMKRQLMRWRIPAHKIVVIPNALRLENYRPDRTDNGFRRSLGVGPEAMLVANIGRLSPEKGQADFLRAARIVLSNHPSTRFVLVGVGPDDAGLRALARELDIESQVEFAGYRNDMIHVYNSLDLVVQSSFTEGMPNVILEALAMEVPVIATDVGGTGEIVEHGVSGILLAPGDSRALGEAMLKCLQDAGTMRRLAQRGAARVRREFDSRKRVRRMQSVYRELLSAGK